MLNSILLLIYLFGFYLFGCGLFVASQFIGYNASQSRDSETNFSSILIRSPRFILGIIIFSIFCNLLLLLPTAIDLICDPSNNIALALHKLMLYTLVAVVVAFSVIGANSILKNLNLFSRDSRWQKLKILDSPKTKGKLDQRCLFSFSLALSGYMLTALNPSYVYDTGLYHLPLVNHLVDYGIEIGLANLHVRYAFYNAQLFGQVPFQALAFSPDFISPSINILFFAALLIFVHDSVLQTLLERGQKRQDSSRIGKNETISTTTTIAYWAAIICFGLTGQNSLISYDSDFSVAVVTAIVIFCLFSKVAKSREIITLALCIPLLKLSGLAAVSYIAILFIFSNLRKITDSITFIRVNRIGNNKIIKDFIQIPILGIIIPGYIIYASTNLTLSGYLSFPQYQTGPIGTHAVPYNDVVTLKDKWITGWARFRYDEHEREILTNADLKTWIPQFISSSRGKKFLFWIGMSGFISAFSLAASQRSKYSAQLSSLFSLSSTTLLTSIIILFALPPDPRFYSWMNGIVYFNCIQFIILSPFLAITLFTMVLCALNIGPKGRISRVSRPEVITKSFSIHILNRHWHSRASDQDSQVRIQQPKSGDQCWSASPPCSPTISSVLEKQ